MLRITRKVERESQVTLYVEGRLVLPEVDELEKETRLLLVAGKNVVLDLGGVISVGAQAVLILKRLRLENVEIRAPALIESVLNEEQERCAVLKSGTRTLPPWTCCTPNSRRPGENKPPWLGPSPTS